MNDLIILALLFDGHKHGYQLKREAGFILGQGDMHNNLVYPLLRRFTSQGWVTRKAVPGQRGQTRQQYSLTAKGRQELLRRLAEYSDEDARSGQAFATRVGMFELMTPETRVQILGKREAYLHEREKRLAILKASMDVGNYGAEVVRFFEEQGQAEIAWIERLRRMQKQKSRGQTSAVDPSAR
jgi:DNA-binding PadR family transcriptional regulator